MLEQLYFHRMQHVEKFFSAKNNSPSFSEITIPSAQELSAYHRGQLSLFPKNSNETHLKWSREKIAFVELFITVHESKAIIGKDDKPVSKKDFMELLMWLFNIRIAQWSRLINSSSDRKIIRESPYLTELNKIFIEYIDKRL
jgi:hypothetical protein